ncbi:hypothetical protein O181_028588 [Austropuccinia psidii MF-1]|uniref:DUF726-domain-containing protein n=1 Tax=Austropuccinia psidii MF-1 TaxID=1389203 RepID=A0A9Q3H1Z1_9BASI|nr:hypothetical protein [Austropuccinia psidii MF-1]
MNPTTIDLFFPTWTSAHLEFITIKLKLAIERFLKSNLSSNLNQDSQDFHHKRNSLAEIWLNEILEAFKIDKSFSNQNLSDQDGSLSNNSLPHSMHLEVLHDLILISLSSTDSISKSKNDNLNHHSFNYSALHRHLIFLFAKSIEIPSCIVYQAEKLVAQQLFFIAQNSNNVKPSEQESNLADSSQSALQQANLKNNSLRYLGTGAGFILGGLAIGLTGGLAAPLIGPALVGLSGGALGFLATSGGTVLIGTLFGIAGGGLTGYRAQRRLQGIQEFSFERLPFNGHEPDSQLPHIPSLHATVVCSGFLLSQNEYKDPWISTFYNTIDKRDVYAIKLETDALFAAGKNLESYLRNTLIEHGAKEIIKHTVLASIYTAILLPASIYKAATTALDNEYQRVRDKCEKGGILLADMIEQKAHGSRPLTLIGSSMGAITIFHAIMELSRRNINDIIDQVIFISSPMSPTLEEWSTIRQTVSRRVVNVFSKNDWVLAILARLHGLLSSRMSLKVAGLMELGIDDIESIDVSDLVHGHLELNSKMSDILERVGINS